MSARRGLDEMAGVLLTQKERSKRPLASMEAQRKKGITHSGRRLGGVGRAGTLDLLAGRRTGMRRDIRMCGAATSWRRRHLRAQLTSIIRSMWGTVVGKRLTKPDRAALFTDVKRDERPGIIAGCCYVVPQSHDGTPSEAGAIATGASRLVPFALNGFPRRVRNGCVLPARCAIRDHRRVVVPAF